MKHTPFYPAYNSEVGLCWTGQKESWNENYAITSKSPELKKNICFFHKTLDPKIHAKLGKKSSATNNAFVFPSSFAFGEEWSAALFSSSAV